MSLQNLKIQLESIDDRIKEKDEGFKELIDSIYDITKDKEMKNVFQIYRYNNKFIICSSSVKMTENDTFQNIEATITFEGDNIIISKFE